MSAATMTGAPEAVSPAPAGSPPIIMILPLLQHIQAGSSHLFYLGIRFIFTIASPLHILWSIVHALLFPVSVAVKLVLDLALFTPFSILRAIAVALYPLYVLCAAACIVGATVGILGHYLSTAILNAISRTSYFAQPPGTPPVSASLFPGQGMLRKRKRRSVRV